MRNDRSYGAKGAPVVRSHCAALSSMILTHPDFDQFFPRNDSILGSGGPTIRATGPTGSRKPPPGGNQSCSVAKTASRAVTSARTLSQSLAMERISGSSPVVLRGTRREAGTGETRGCTTWKRTTCG